MKDYPLYEVDDCNSFADFLKVINEKYYNNIAFMTRENKWTYNEVYENIIKCIFYLKDFNNENVIINVKNSCYFFIAYFAVVLSGNIAFLTNKLTDLNKEPTVLNDEKISLIVSRDISISSKIYDFELNPNDLCTVVCSSGTTSSIKGIKLSQKNLLADTIAGMKIYEYKENCVYLNILPYTHLFGIVADLLGPLYSGSTICFSNNVLNFFSDLLYFKPTNLNLPPVMVDSIYNILKSTGDFTQATGGQLKKILCAGAKMNDSVNEEFSKYGLRAYAAYGLTECSPCISINRDNFYKQNSVGKVLPCCKVRIVDGEITVKGDNVMIGYLNDDESTNRIIRHGWLYTGDLGYIDDDGFIYITGRLSNMIVFEDGNKLVPEFLEGKINGIPNVKESMVQGIQKYGRMLLLINIVSDSYETELIRSDVIDICKKIGLSQRLSDIIFTKELFQKNNLGKIIRNKDKIKLKTGE